MIRFILLVILLLFSLLTVFKAPAFPLWLAAILVSEFSWVFILLTLIIVLGGLRASRLNLPGTIAGVTAIILLLVPIVNSFYISKHLPEELNKAFNISNSKVTGNNPFSLGKLFAKAPQLNFERLEYVKYTDTALTLDFYRAKAKHKRPCVVIIHGGSWSSGDSGQLPELNSYLAAQGYHAAAINYRLAPRYKNPAPVQDVQQALRYLHNNAERLNIDTGKFILLGRSAGGQIALLAAYTLANEGIRGVIDFYGPADMVWGYSVPANPLVMNSRLVMEKYLGGSYRQVPASYMESSPVEFVSEKTVPTLMIHGQNDVLVAYQHSIRLSACLQKKGVRHYLLTLPWATHGFDYHLNGPGGQLSTYAVLRFLQAIAP